MESWSTCTSNCINDQGYTNYQDQGLPPGFRFHPTDEELVTHYLAKKMENPGFACAAVSDADLNKSEPWELPEKAQMGEKEWYFFSARDRKYPTGMRTNRATEAGYWKATGKDREVVSGSGSASQVVGMKKTLVFYRGRAPKGIKTNWVMHEYRNEGHKLSSARGVSSHCKEEWVVCRIFHKTPGGKKMGLSELRQGSHLTSESGAAYYSTSLPALLDSPIPTNSSGGRSDQENLMFNVLLQYNNSGIKSEPNPYNDGPSLFSSTSMASLVARSNVTTSIISPYTSTTSTPGLLSSVGSNAHNATTNATVVPNHRASYLLAGQGVSTSDSIMASSFNNRSSPQNISTLTPSNYHNHQHHLSNMQNVNPTSYTDPLLSTTSTTTTLAPPLAGLSSDLETFWLYSDRL